MKMKQYTDRLSSVSNISSCAFHRIVPKLYCVFKQMVMVILRNIFLGAIVDFKENLKNNSPKELSVDCQSSVSWPLAVCRPTV